VDVSGLKNFSTIVAISKPISLAILWRPRVKMIVVVPATHVQGSTINVIVHASF
jgi:hypothetical protein